MIARLTEMAVCVRACVRACGEKQVRRVKNDRRMRLKRIAEGDYFRVSAVYANFAETLHGLLAL